MKPHKSLTIAGCAYTAEQLPLVCTPLVASTHSALLEETRRVMAKKPDLIEWRVDFYEHIDNTEKVVATAKDIKLLAGSVPILFTRRARHEGGEEIPLSEEEVLALYQSVCEQGCVDLVDYELSNPPANLQTLIACAHAQQIQVIASYHNFQETPDTDFLLERLTAAQAAGADLGKIAVMPQQLDDILRLLQATLSADRQLDIPLISISMGPYGALTRMIGGVFGSSLTFAVGASSSAPGQLAIEDVHQVLEIIRRSTVVD